MKNSATSSLRTQRRAQRRLIESYIREVIQSSSSPKLLASSSHVSIVLERLDRDFDVLLSEGVMEDLRGAYETAKSGALKLKEKISDASLAAMQKVNEFFMSAVQRAVSAIKSSPEALAKIASSIINKVEAFRKNHPLLFNAVLVVVVIIIIVGVQVLFEKSAHADVAEAGKALTKQKYETLRGLLLDYQTHAGSSDIDKQLKLADAIDKLDAAARSKNLVDVKSIQSAAGDVVSRALSVLNKINKEAASGDAGAQGVIERWIDLGKNTVMIYTKM